MTKSSFAAALIFCPALLISLSSLASGNSQGKALIKKNKKNSETNVRSWMKDLPVEFIENNGQIMDSKGNSAPYVLFKAEAPGVDLFVTESGLTYVFLEYSEDENEKDRQDPYSEDDKIEVRYERMDMDLAGATIRKENIIKEEPSPAYCNYILGPGDKSFYYVKKYRKVTITNIYPGIDWVLYNSGTTGFKYDFVVHPGADPKQIELVYRSKKQAALNEAGNLLIGSGKGNLEEKAPYSYLATNKEKIGSSFYLKGSTKKSGMFESRFGIDVQVPGQQLTQDLIIDPWLYWSTFYGGTSFEGTWSIDTDGSGNFACVGYGASSNFPLLNSGGYFLATLTSGFIIKFNNTGTLLWSTFFGGSGTQTQYVTCDNNNNVFICGSASSPTFPVQNNNTYFQPATAGSTDAYISKFDNTGVMIWSTFYGGSSNDNGTSVACDNAGNVFLTGITSSPNFPVQNANTYFDGTYAAGGGFIVKFDNNGNRLWATYIKGISTAIVNTDNLGNVLMTGQSNNTLFPVYNPGGTAYFQGATAGGFDAYILKFDNLGNQLWGTFYGGSVQEVGYSIAGDKAGNVFVTGSTTSTNLPTQNAGGYFQPTIAATLTPDAFMLKFSNNCTMLWATYFGGTRQESFLSSDNMTIDTCGNVYVAMNTISRNMPLQNGCDGGYYRANIDTSVNAFTGELYICRFTNNTNLTWATYLGGDGNDFRTSIEADKRGDVFATGEWATVTNTLTYPVIYPGGTSYTAGFVASDDLYFTKFMNNVPLQAFSYSTYCTNDTNQVPLLPPNFSPGGTFTAAPGLVLNPTTGMISPAMSTPGTYTVSYKKAACYCPGAAATTVGTATLSIMAAPNLTVAGNQTICVNQKTTYTASGAPNYTWSNGPTTATMAITPTATGTVVYTVTSKNTNGCAAKKIITVKVNKCTGIEETAFGNAQILIYPNPNNGEFTISSQKDITLNLYSETGQLFKVITLTENNKRSVQIEGLSNGVYFIGATNSLDNAAYKIIVEK